MQQGRGTHDALGADRAQWAEATDALTLIQLRHEEGNVRVPDYALR